MSYTDIQAQAALLPLAERIELTRYLAALETEDELRVLLSQRMRAMDAGRCVSLDAFKEKHEQLEAEGRRVTPHKVILDSDLAESLCLLLRINDPRKGQLGSETSRVTIKHVYSTTPHR